MAIIQNPLTADSTSVNNTVFTTASVTNTANRLLLLAVANSPVTDVTDPPSPTVAGLGLIWEEIKSVNFSVSGANNLANLAVFRALGASSTGPITLTYGTTQDHVCWALSEFDGIDTGGTNGSSAIVQSEQNSAGAVNTVTATLAAFSSANNATYGASAVEFSGGTRTFTAGSGFTEIHDVSPGVNLSLETEWRNDNDTTVDQTISSSTNRGCAVIGIEIKAVAAGTTHVSWTDGTPLLSSSNNTSGVYIAGVGSGFSITVPADKTTKTLKVYVGGFNSAGTFTAHLSDNSASDFVDATTLIGGQYSRNYTLTYTAGSDDQNLTITWVQSSGAGNVALIGAALTETA